MKSFQENLEFQLIALGYWVVIAEILEIVSNYKDTTTLFIDGEGICRSLSYQLKAADSQIVFVKIKLTGLDWWEQ